MACEKFAVAGGVAIVCNRGRRRDPGCMVPGCGRPTAALCDYPLGGGKTCDRRMCAVHRTRVTPILDACPPHAKAASTATTHNQEP